ncbi:MAG: AraC family transcriptional regulator [Alphaproteobacteria bacterium]|nr:AraC family transcriptional regulator [Alphaproteobacteria bacterium]MBV9370785.1 AraC family transcriptional regulator [Alphaproteobacteria bacterium]MBV9900135.1 AraC family transcriptional regulator [Alphaproteobacteria bacterium]
MIESGSLTAGIDPGDFRLPPGTALRYERPAPELRDYLTSYAVLDSMVEGTRHGCEWMLPGWAQIWIVMTPEPIRVRIGNRGYEPSPGAVLYGVTSRAMPITARGGVTICIDVSPLGWARLFSRSAESFRDRLVPLETLLPGPLVSELGHALARSDRALQVKGILDDLFARRMGTPNPEEARIRQIWRAIADEDVADLTAAASLHGMAPRTASRLSKQYFGFPPKLLLMRSRFLRALLTLLDAGPGADHSQVPRGYHDRSHFLRDGRRFLGMTPRRFLAQPSPYAAAARRARRLVIGTPIPSLDRP